MANSAEQSRTWADRGWYLVLEFGHSNSDRYDSVVRLAARGPGYIALLDENRALVHRNLYRADHDLRRFRRLLDRVRAWKSARLFVCGNPVTAEEAAPAIQCYLSIGNHALCTGRWRAWPMFIGCPNQGLAITPASDAAWFRRAQRSGFIFRLDKPRVWRQFESGLRSARCCPLVQAEAARRLLQRLPAEINPREDRRWRVERDHWSPLAWDGLRPASEEAYAEYLREIFRGLPPAEAAG